MAGVIRQEFGAAENSLPKALRPHLQRDQKVPGQHFQGRRRECANEITQPKGHRNARECGSTAVRDVNLPTAAEGSTTRERKARPEYEDAWRTRC